MSNVSVVRRTVFCTLTWEALHRWPDAPDSVDYLRDRHRHEFHCRFEAAVDHNDRDVEIVTMKHDLASIVNPSFCGDIGTLSCEDIAEGIASEMRMEGYNPTQVTVSEDGENGATLSFRPPSN